MSITCGQLFGLSKHSLEGKMVVILAHTVSALVTLSAAYQQVTSARDSHSPGAAPAVRRGLYRLAPAGEILSSCLPTANCIADWHTSMWKSRCRNVSAQTYHLTTASHDCRPRDSRPFPRLSPRRHRCTCVSLQCWPCRPDNCSMGRCTDLLPAILLPLSNKCQLVLFGILIEQGQPVSCSHS